MAAEAASSRAQGTDFHRPAVDDPCVDNRVRVCDVDSHGAYTLAAAAAPLTRFHHHRPLPIPLLTLQVIELPTVSSTYTVLSTAATAVSTVPLHQRKAVVPTRRQLQHRRSRVQMAEPRDQHRLCPVRSDAFDDVSAP